MTVDWDLGPVIAAFFNAALDLAPWTTALDLLGAATGSVGACLLPVEGPSIPFAHSAVLEPAYLAYWNQGWVHRDERFRAVPALRQKHCATEFDFTTPEEMAKHPYWQEFLAPHGLQWFAGVSVTFGATLWCIAIQRSPAQGPFVAEEQAMLGRLSSHVSSAGLLADTFSRARREGLLAAFNMNRRAVLLVGAAGEVVAVNESAEALLGPDLQIAQGRIRSYDRKATAELAGAIETLVREGTCPFTPAIVRLPRRERRPLIAYLAKPSAEVAHPFATVLVTLLDLDDVASSREAALMTCFELTRAEARLAAELASGCPLDEAARRIGVAYETARTQLRGVFEKLDIHRQSELAATVTMLAERTRSS